MNDAFNAGALLRAARSAANLSQRELAAATGTDRRTIAAVESGLTRSVGVVVLCRLLAATDCRLAVLTKAGRVLKPLGTDHVRDRGDRKFPAHLPVRRVEQYGDWWCDGWPSRLDDRPDWTFDGRPRGPRRRRGNGVSGDGDAGRPSVPGEWL
ncbi:MAG: Transcriptional regulator, family [Frankiales bacterium]|nr:Transcriptional regulator, family [Frankiales bacterium]